MMTAPVTPDGRRRAERTRRAILAAAESCFREVGYAAGTSAEIAARAGVAEGTIYAHFGSKAGLLAAIARDYYARLQAEVEADLRFCADAADGLRRVVDTMATRMEVDWALISVTVPTGRSELDSEAAEIFLEFSRRFTSLVVRLVRELGSEGRMSTSAPPLLIRDMIFGALEHTARRQAMAGAPIEVRGAGMRVLDLLLQAERVVVDDRLGAVENKLDMILERVQSHDTLAVELPSGTPDLGVSDR